MHKHQKVLEYAGLKPGESEKAMIMVHGRGGNALDILGLASHLQARDLTFLAPQATGNTWYPNSFMAPRRHNEPGLSSGLEVLEATLSELLDVGYAAEQIYFLGFSQGACLTVEFLATHPQKYAGAFILSGGLIGDVLDEKLYAGTFQGTPMFFGITDRDPHVPLSRVEASAKICESLGAAVTLEVYPGRPHGIYPEEIVRVNAMLTSDKV